MFQTIHEIDVYLTELIASLLPHNELFDIIFAFFSLYGLSIIIWAVMIIYLVYVRHREDKTFVPTLIFSFISTSLIVDFFLKNIIQRPRPWMAQGLENVFCPVHFSFPSGHASAAFAGATVFAAYDPKHRSLYYGIAILISLSRIYLVCHYLLDVIFGALIAYLWVKLILYLKANSKKLWGVQ